MEHFLDDPSLKAGGGAGNPQEEVRLGSQVPHGQHAAILLAKRMKGSG